MLNQELMSKALGVDYNHEYWIMDDYLYKIEHKIPVEYQESGNPAVDLARVFAAADYYSETDYRNMTSYYMMPAFYNLLIERKYDSAFLVLKAVFDNQDPDPDILRGVLYALMVHYSYTGETIGIILLNKVTDKSISELLKFARMGKIRTKLPGFLKFLTTGETLGVIGWTGLLVIGIWNLIRKFIEGHYIYVATLLVINIVVAVWFMRKEKNEK